MKTAFFYCVLSLRLVRIKLSLSVAFSAFVSYVVAGNRIDLNAFFAFFGVLLLSMGASALNQIQERKFDALMQRTSSRPIPAGNMSVDDASGLAGLYISLGLFTLYFFGTFYCLLFGIFSLIWYNGVYTYLKRITALALIPGTLTGVIPILIGWNAAGGFLNDSRLLWISLFMALWQLPHFILLMLHYNDDYKRAGFPVLTELLSVKVVKIVIFLGTILIAVESIYLIKLKIFDTTYIAYAVIVLLLINIALTFVDLFIITKYRSLISFISINVLMLFVLLCFLADRLIYLNYFAQFNL